MALTPLNFVPNEMRTSIVKIYSYEHKVLCGSFYNPYLKIDKKFSSFMELLLLMRDNMEELNCPQSNIEVRSFIERTQNKSQLKDYIDNGKKPLATFKIKVLFRQNETWQGSIIWVDKEMESQFRSIVEMMLLIDSVLDSK